MRATAPDSRAATSGEPSGSPFCVQASDAALFRARGVSEGRRLRAWNRPNGSQNRIRSARGISRSRICNFQGISYRISYLSRQFSVATSRSHLFSTKSTELDPSPPLAHQLQFDREFPAFSARSRGCFCALWGADSRAKNLDCGGSVSFESTREFGPCSPHRDSDSAKHGSLGLMHRLSVRMDREGVRCDFFGTF